MHFYPSWTRFAPTWFSNTTNHTTDLTIPSFQRVTDIDFDDHEPVRVVKAVRVDNEEADW